MSKQASILWGSTPNKKTPIQAENTSPPKKIKKKPTTKIKYASEPVTLIGPKNNNKQEEKEEIKRKKLELFDFIDILFTKPDEFQKLSLYERGKFCFMIQRYMSIMNPVQACVLDKIGINQGEVVSFWEFNIGRKLKSKPSWLWVKTKKQQKINKYQPTEELAFKYRSLHKIDKKVYDEAFKFFPDDMEKELKEFDNLINWK